MSSPDAAARDGSASRPEADRPVQTFPRRCRLTSRRQYLDVYKKGKRVYSGSFVLFGLKNDLDTCRLGITATRKVGSAVKRNRAKRLVREVFRRNRTRLRPPLDLVVNVRSELAERPYAELEAEFLKAFRRLARRVRS